MPRSTSSLMSRCAVGIEHFPIAAHFFAVSLPSNPSRNLVEYCLLSFVESLAGVALPEVGLAQNICASRLGTVERARKAVEEPSQPIGDVERALLRAFKHVVIVRPFLPDLTRHAVEALS